MNILLDYFFPIDAIEPTPQASTGFLKQACLVVKKNGGGTDGVITLCTTNAAVAVVTDNTEASQLFNAGMDKVYILCSPDLDIADALEGHESDFHTLIVSSDFDDEDLSQVTDDPAVAASREIGDITFTAVHDGVAGNSITVELADTRTDGGAYSHAVGNVITIAIEDGVTLAQTIIDAVTESVSSSALVVATLTGSNVAQDLVAPTSLQNGAARTTVDGTGLQVGAFKGVVGVSSTDDEVLAEQAAISHRAAFHTTSGNKAKNMCYAFGKMLSNALNWRNQQYITMPFADDVDTLGAANTLFDDKIDFVISDDEFGNRLGLFACGGKAIVGPYIERNLELDFQSAALSYISGNQPSYSKKHAALIEDELKKVIQLYINREWITAGTVQVLLEQDNFVASGYINIAEPKALWRIFGEMRQTL